ncbi:hypothetical protein PENSPDRAFT_301992 [Peniophora sp. CONT]|nr:hypothetical protein PENSPDRAFT_301992 [Peniophora sp. CONT]
MKSPWNLKVSLSVSRTGKGEENMLFRREHDTSRMTCSPCRFVARSVPGEQDVFRRAEQRCALCGSCFLPRETTDSPGTFCSPGNGEENVMSWTCVTHRKTSDSPRLSRVVKSPGKPEGSMGFPTHSPLGILLECLLCKLRCTYHIPEFPSSMDRNFKY